MLDLFWDDTNGGVFTGGNDAEELLVRRKDFFDSPIPSANANAAFALLRVAAIHGRSDLVTRSEEIMALASSAASANPQAHARMVAAFDLAFGSMTQIVVTGNRRDLLDEVRRAYLPNSVVLHGERFESPLWTGRTGDQAYVCKNYTCDLPTDDPAQLREQIKNSP